MSSHTVARLRILGAAALFSTGGTAIKLVALSSWQVAGLRSLIAAVALWIAMPEWRRGFDRRTFLVGLAYGATMVLYVAANKRTTAAATIFLQSSAPMYLLLLGPWLLAERIRRRDMVLTVAIAAGLVALLLGRDAPMVSAPDPFLGNILGAICGVTWALTIVGLRWLGRETNALARARTGAAVISGNLTAFAIAAPFCFPLEARAIDLAVVGYLGVFQIGLAYVLMTGGVGRITALEASLLLLLEPVVSAVLAWTFLDERPGGWSLLGGALILGATVVSALRPRADGDEAGD